MRRSELYPGNAGSDFVGGFGCHDMNFALNKFGIRRLEVECKSSSLSHLIATSIPLLTFVCIELEDP
jgi:hypothetical protein